MPPKESQGQADGPVAVAHPGAKCKIIYYDILYYIILYSNIFLQGVSGIASLPSFWEPWDLTPPSTTRSRFCFEIIQIACLWLRVLLGCEAAINFPPHIAHEASPMPKPCIQVASRKVWHQQRSHGRSDERDKACTHGHAKRSHSRLPQHYYDYYYYYCYYYNNFSIIIVIVIIIMIACPRPRPDKSPSRGRGCRGRSADRRAQPGQPGPSGLAGPAGPAGVSACWCTYLRVFVML